MLKTTEESQVKSIKYVSPRAGHLVQAFDPNHHKAGVGGSLLIISSRSELHSETLPQKYQRGGKKKSQIKNYPSGKLSQTCVDV